MNANGCVIEGTPIAVDFWRPTKTPQAQLFFLTHLHADHTQGLTQSWRLPIYTSPVNALLLKHKFKLPDNIVRELEVGESYLLPLDNENTHTMTVTVIDANHVPGAVMYLFQGYFGNILYCGDMRWYPEILDNVVLRNVVVERQLDVLYLDNTFSAPYCIFPPRHIVQRDLMTIIESYPDHIIKLGIRELGRESLLEEIAHKFRERILVPQTKYECLQILRCSDVFTTDPDKARIHAVPMSHITVASHKQWNKEHPTISIILTALYVGWDKGPYSSSSVTGIFVVPYSDHSSYPELMEMVAQLVPRRILPVVKKVSKSGWWSDPQCPDQSVKTDMSVYDHLLTLPPPEPMVIPDSVLLTMKEGHLRLLCQMPRRCGLQRGLSPRRGWVRGVHYSSPPSSLPSSPPLSSVHSPPRSYMISPPPHPSNHSTPPRSYMNSPPSHPSIHSTPPRIYMNSPPPHSSVNSPPPNSCILSSAQWQHCIHSPPAQPCAGMHSTPQCCTSMHLPPPQQFCTCIHSHAQQSPSPCDINSPAPISNFNIDGRVPSPDLSHTYPHPTLPPPSPFLSVQSSHSHMEIQAPNHHSKCFSSPREILSQLKESAISVPPSNSDRVYSINEHCLLNNQNGKLDDSHQNNVIEKNKAITVNLVHESRPNVESWLNTKSSKQPSRDSFVENLNDHNRKKRPLPVIIAKTNDLLAVKYTRLNNEGITIKNISSIIKDTEELFEAVADGFTILAH